MSACAFIFVAGWDKPNHEPFRVKHPNGKLGLHHPWRYRGKKKGTGKQNSSQEILDIVGDYLDLMLAGDPLYKLMVRTSYKKMGYISNKTLRRLPGYYIKKEKDYMWPKPRPFNTGPMMKDARSANGAPGQDTSWDQRPHTHPGQAKPHTHGESKPYNNTVVLSGDFFPQGSVTP